MVSVEVAQAWRNVSRDTGTLLSPRFKTTGTLSFSLLKHYKNLPKSQKSPGLVPVVPPPIPPGLGGDYIVMRTILLGFQARFGSVFETIKLGSARLAG